MPPSPRFNVNSDKKISFEHYKNQIEQKHALYKNEIKRAVLKVSIFLKQQGKLQLSKNIDRVNDYMTSTDEEIVQLEYDNKHLAIGFQEL